MAWGELKVAAIHALRFRGFVKTNAEQHDFGALGKLDSLFNELRVGINRVAAVALSVTDNVQTNCFRAVLKTV